MACWIDQPSELKQRYQQRAPDLHQIGLDTEFIHESTYWPQLALVQMAVGDEIWLVDPLVPGMNQALRLWLDDAHIVKIMHSASQDMMVFKHSCDAVPQPLFDTQIGASLAGMGSGSYQKLVTELANVELPKNQTRSNWLRRPLSAAQLDYAADDVRYLFVLANAISARLQDLDRTAWFEEDIQRLLVAHKDNDHAERWVHLHHRAAQGMDIAAQMRLLRLLRWREENAQQRNLPRNWIIDNQLVAILARTPPTNEAALKRLLSASRKAPRRLAHTLWQALNTPLADETHALHLLPYMELNKPALRRMQEAVAQRSAELGLPDGVLASRKWLVELLQSGQWPQALIGWRKTQLEPLLRPFLP